MEFDKFLIPATATIKDALLALNTLHNTTMTLFVVDDSLQLLGTLTDGDIRRGLIAGLQLGTPVTQAMRSEFQSVRSFEEVGKVRELKERDILLIPVLDGEGRIQEVIDLSLYSSKLPVDAVLMAGGKGERLRPLTLETPKPLLKIGDKAIIDYNVERLIDAGMKNIYVTVNYLKDKIIDHFREPFAKGVKVNCVAEKEFYGTIGALKLVEDFHSDTILVMNSDLLTDIDYEDFYLHFKQHDADMSAAAIPYTVSVPYGIFELDGRNILGVKEKPTYSLYANAGIYLIKKEVLRYIPDNEVFNATDLITKLAENGGKVIRYPLTSLWIDIGTPDEFRKAQEIVRHIKA